MTATPLNSEHHINVCTGACVGIAGRSGSAIDAMGFVFVRSTSTPKARDRGLFDSEERRRRLRDDLDKTVLRLALTESEASDSERVKSTSKRLTSESLQSRLGAIERSELLRFIDEQDAEYQEEQKKRFNEKRDEQKSGGSNSEGSQGQERAYQKEAAALRRVEVEGEWESRSEGGSKRDRQTMSRDRTERGWHSDSTAGPKDESRDSPFHGRQAQTSHHSASKGGASGDEDYIQNT
ncbi:Aerolysin-like protein [Dissostichus eleginoides]|uniref:Aerolysin-like protein n=1 Tax=Dissostichus eleginoides TaxID=100907 RepID=A0AAD9B2Q1_DISEL|nr:Aerolysin-like protein [Dissostichus eleginoides]